MVSSSFSSAFLLSAKHSIDFFLTVSSSCLSLLLSLCMSSPLSFFLSFLHLSCFYSYSCACRGGSSFFSSSFLLSVNFHLLFLLSRQRSSPSSFSPVQSLLLSRRERESFLTLPSLLLLKLLWSSLSLV